MCKYGDSAVQWVKDCVQYMELEKLHIHMEKNPNHWTLNSYHIENSILGQL